jgi:hypothetical protein
MVALAAANIFGFLAFSPLVECQMDEGKDRVASKPLWHCETFVALVLGSAANER